VADPKAFIHTASDELLVILAVVVSSGPTEVGHIRKHNSVENVRESYDSVSVLQQVLLAFASIASPTMTLEYTISHLAAEPASPTVIEDSTPNLQDTQHVKQEDVSRYACKDSIVLKSSLVDGDR
jgi:hypothetical protein